MYPLFQVCLPRCHLLVLGEERFVLFPNAGGYMVWTGSTPRLPRPHTTPAPYAYRPSEKYFMPPRIPNPGPLQVIQGTGITLTRTDEPYKNAYGTFGETPVPRTRKGIEDAAPQNPRQYFYVPSARLRSLRRERQKRERQGSLPVRGSKTSHRSYRHTSSEGGGGGAKLHP